MHILLVDDEPLLLATLMIELEDAGYKVTTASNGANAIRIISEQQKEGVGFDAIITDRNMPQADGIVLLQWLSGAFSDPPPTLLHSADDQAEIKTGDQVELLDLIRIAEIFPFAAYHNKITAADYVHQFLDSLKSR